MLKHKTPVLGIIQKKKIPLSTRCHKIKSNSEYMPPFRPLFRCANIRNKACYSKKSTLKAQHVFQNPVKMTVTEISKFEHSEETLTLPDLPPEYLDVTLSDSEGDSVEEITESYPLAISDATEESILNSKKLTDGENVKEIYLIELSSSFPSYNPGDTIGIITQNRKEDVQLLFEHLEITNLSKIKCKVCEKNQSLKKPLSKPAFVNKTTTLSHIFTHCLDIYCIPKKSLIRVLSEFTKDPSEKQQLRELCSKEKSDLYMKNILEANKSFLDCLLTFPSCKPPVARLIENLPKLLPRPYSIASSPLASPDRVKIVFSVIKAENDKEGLCTGMLKSIINNQNEKRIKIFFRKCNGFNLPDTDEPLILVGPGTGIAPFMGFLEHRRKQEAKGVVWLFYGCRFREGDYLFKEELQEYLDAGVLTRLLVAFSRDCDAEAKYVQDNMRKYGEELCELIFNKNARIYVCGDAKNMRRDIQNSFVEIFQNHKGLTNKEATDFIKKLQKEKRYLQDIWL